MNTQSISRTTLSINGGPFRFAVVVSNFNSPVTDRLLEGSLECFSAHGVLKTHVKVVRCPGAFELPQIANVLAAQKKYHAIVCLGAVIRGETPHFEFVAGEAARGIQEVSLRHTLPVIFGVLTTNNLKQALDRVGGKHGHKGWDAALTAIEMASLVSSLKRKNR